MNQPGSDQIDQFILEQIDTVPHLEALLLLWNKRPKSWPAQEIAHALYVPEDVARGILRDLTQRGLLRESSELAEQFQYVSSREQDQLIEQLDATYRRELIRISRMIHAKAPSALRDFARAFRFTKEKE